MKQEIYVGARVQVINQDSSGVNFVEGYAIVKGFAPEPRYNDYVYCSVQFDGESECYYRWIASEVI